MGCKTRVTDAIRCPKCEKLDAYERRGEGGWEILCPDCGDVFAFDDLPRKCLGEGCGRSLLEAADVSRGLCGSCRLKLWSPEKRQAINNLIGMAFKRPAASDADKRSAVDHAVKFLDEAD